LEALEESANITPRSLLFLDFAMLFEELVEEQSAGTLYAMQKRRTRNIMPQGSASQSVDI
jgi:hypothetical protein